MLCSLTGALLGGAAHAQDMMLFNFDTPEQIAAFEANGTQLSQFVNPNIKALKIEFLADKEWPNAYYGAPEPMNWNQRALAFDVFNPETVPVAFSVRVDDDPSADGNVHCRTGNGSIASNARRTFVMQFGPDAMSLGMRGLPTSVNAQFSGLNAGGQGEFHPEHIVGWQIFLHAPKTTQTLIVDNVRLLPLATSNLKNIVNRFGQYAPTNWPGKLTSEAELQTRRRAEETRLNGPTQLPNRDRFGGWTNGPQLKATGWFRTEKVDGKWWLVDPEGRVFFSNGVDTMNLGNGTMITGREQMFADLPAANDPLHKFFSQTDGILYGPTKSGQQFDFYGANLQRKYGADYPAQWTRTALQRLRAWGFNTVGNWSDETLKSESSKIDAGNLRIPYVATASIDGNHARVASGDDYWGKMHDPFDPQFAVDAANSLKWATQQSRNDPFCIGYFVDNELSWGGGDSPQGRYALALGALKLPMSSPSKAAFVAQLKRDYSSVAALNTSWNVKLKSLQELETPFKTETINEAMQKDLQKFSRAFALKYFTVVRDALHKLDANHLYLGCRFAWRSPEAVEAAAQVCDVVSFNVYKRTLDKTEWSFANAVSKPCIIGEFHFGALDRGMFHTGLVPTENQNDRARAYIDYVQSVADHPAFVGCHWFQYIDEPLTGRVWDGENYNIGMVDVTDTPYPELTVAARQVHATVYQRHAAAK